jgi:NADH-quinone oxidoreductase subunit J
VNSVLHSLLFYVFAIIVLGSAVFTAFSPNLVHAAFSLLFTFFGLACMYILAGADFVGISQIIIYVGGILVLLLFGVMFTGRQEGGSERKQTIQMKRGLLLLAGLLLMMIPMIFMTDWNVMLNPAEKTLESTITPVGVGLLTTYLLPFEIASLLLLIALIGAVVIARGEPKAGETEQAK